MRQDKYHVEFAEWNPEPLSLDADEVPDDVGVVEYVETNYDIWELSVRPGRWNGDEFDAVSLAATDKESAKARALDVHRNYSSVIDHSEANLGSADVERVTTISASEVDVDGENMDGFIAKRDGVEAVGHDEKDARVALERKLDESEEIEA